VPAIAFSQLELRWERTYGGDNWEFPMAIAKTANSGFALAGSTRSFGPNHENNSNAYAIRTDRDGELLWSRAFGEEGEESFRGVTTGQGDCSFFIGTSSSYEILCVKYDVEGEQEWSNTFSRGALTMGYKAIPTEDGGYILGGIIALGGGQLQYGLFKIDAEGNEEWVRQYGEIYGSNTFGLTKTTDGGVALTGQNQWLVEGHLHDQLFLMKTDESGELIWQQFYGEFSGFASSVIQTSDGGYAIGGFQRENDTTRALLLKVDSRGRREWQRLFHGDGANAWVGGLLQTCDDGYIIGCVIDGENDNDQGDILLIRLDSEGEENWRQVYATEQTNQIAGIVECEDFGYAILGSKYTGQNTSDFWLIRTEMDTTCNHPPRWLERPMQSYEVIIGDRLQASLRAVDYDGDEVQISLIAENLPQNLNITVLDGDGIDIDFPTDGEQPAEYSMQAVASDGEFADTLTITIQVLNPALSASVEALNLEFPAGDPFATQFQLINLTEDSLGWRGEPRLSGEAGNYSNWDLRANVALNSLNDEAVEIHAVCFVDGIYYLAVSSANEISIVGVNRAGDVVSVAPQPGNSETGFTDMTWDGEYLWGVDGREVWIVGLDGDLIGLFEGPFQENQAIAYDSQRDIYWISGISTDVVGYDSGGIELTRINRRGLHIYGLAFWADDPDGMSLYLLDNPENSQQMLYRLNPDDGEPQFVHELQQAGRAAPGGAFISTEYDSAETVVFMNVATSQAGASVNVWHLYSNVGWMTLEPDAGVIGALSEANVELRLGGLVEREEPYRGVLRFMHDGWGRDLEIPLSVQVVANEVGQDDHRLLPLQMSVEAYPNPFNAATSLEYSLPKAGRIVLAIYDAEGRLVETLRDATQTTGSYRITWSAGSAPTGVYFGRLEAGEVRLTTKLLLVR